MSATSIQRKLFKAYGKVAKKIGFPADVFRVAQSYNKPLSDVNWIDQTAFSVSQNDKFNAPVGSNLWLAWIDGTLSNQFDLQVGDIIQHPHNGQVFYIIDMHSNHPIRALECNSTISISSLEGYTDNGSGWGASQLTPTGADVPAWVSVTGSQSIDGGFVPGRTALSQGNDVYTIQLWMPEGSIRPNDVITLKDGTELTVGTASWDIRGYKLTAAKVA